jgi:hypothetical protein
MTARGLPARSGFLVLVLIILASCSSGNPLVPLKPTPTPGIDFPSPAPTEVGPAPQNCPKTSPLPETKVFPAGWGGYLVNTTLYGKTPVWSDFQPDMQVGPVPNHYNPWPGTKVLWEVGPNVTQTVTVRVTNTTTGKAAWWDVGEGAPPPSSPERPLVLDGTLGGNHGSPEPGWQEWGTWLYILEAGCYSMDVSWPGGHWRLLFSSPG